MGQNIQRIGQALVGKIGKQYRVLDLGIDGAGKTTILYKLKLGQTIASIPTIGFNVETLEYKNTKLTCWDVGGADKIRMLWRHYYLNTNAIIYVVNSAQEQRLDTARQVLHKMLQEDELANVPVLIFSNKSDLSKIGIPEMTQRLELSKLKNQWYIISSNAHTGEGLYDGLQWLVQTLKNNDKAKFTKNKKK